MEDLIAAMQENQRQAEVAYDAMCDARPSAARECFDDARGFLAKAIDLARQAGLDDAVARLTVRADRVVKVYNSQFRNIW